MKKLLATGNERNNSALLNFYCRYAELEASKNAKWGCYSGPYSWLLFKERISWVKSHLNLGRGLVIHTGREVKQFYIHSRGRFTLSDLHGSQATGCAGALALLWKFQVPDTEHQTHLWTYLPLPIDLLNKLRYLKSISKNSLHCSWSLLVSSENAMF